MLYIIKGQVNELVMNINNNARPEFTGYTLTFTHIMSMEIKSYLINTANPAEYSQNIRYCLITLPLDVDDLNYEGEYQLNIFGQGGGYTDFPVFTGIAILEGTTEEPSFTQYISPNEVNENYIYIQENQTPTPTTISVYSQVIDFGAYPGYNSINYKCDGTTIHSCYAGGTYTNISDLVTLFNSKPNPLPPGCTDPTYCYCWSDYGTYYDNGDGKIRCEMPIDVYNSLCNGGSLTLDVIYD